VSISCRPSDVNFYWLTRVQNKQIDLAKSDKSVSRRYYVNLSVSFDIVINRFDS
jgi:hypothetical protein